MIRIELIRAWPHRCETATAELSDQATVGDALVSTGWSLDEDFVGLAVYGVAVTPATRLHDGDRIELLRKLQLDPKQARRLRAARSNKTD